MMQQPVYNALNAAANGHLVIPVNGKTKKPLVAIAEASSDPEVIRQLKASRLSTTNTLPTRRSSPQSCRIII